RLQHPPCLTIALLSPATSRVPGTSPQPLAPAAPPCSLPLDEGDCHRYTLRWYYNQRAAECRPFVYGGCRGSLNRFDSREDCELRCGRRAGAPPGASRPSGP
uniref:BPTI/Kunitz inhibitor domain-containing protein n=1 Tax=Dromaius novaehollandiae TaxID=8790 RepID=A0A8C4P8P3_DRONO